MKICESKSISLPYTEAFEKMFKVLGFKVAYKT